jgi:hypothetical protein
MNQSPIITTTFATRPGSIAENLGKKLGRTPTNEELKAEVKRILSKP